MSIENVIGERIAQLDNLYSATHDLRAKALILSQMIALAEKIDVKVDIEFDELRSILYSSYVFTYIFYREDSKYNVAENCKNIAYYIIAMDKIRADLIYELVEKGYITKFKEIPIAIDETLKDVEGSL